MEPSSWGELLRGYRAGQALATTAAAQPQVRLTRSVPSVCPLAETTHPLFSVGATGQHTINAQDGSYQRSQRHGWGDTSLLKADGHDGQPHPRGQHAPQGKRPVPAPCKDGRNSLFGLLDGSEAGAAPDSWLGNISVDPTKGRRAVSAPTDPKRSVPLSALLAQTAPGGAESDAWIGHRAIDPARGKGRVPDPGLSGRPDLFSVLQQQVLRDGGGCCSGSCSCSGGTQRSAADDDAWMGNRLIRPGKGRRGVDAAATPAAASLLRGAAFTQPAGDCWTDLPRISKHPAAPPASSYVSAAQALAMEVPLPPGTLLAPPQQSKGMVRDPHGRAAEAAAGCSRRVDMYSLITFAPLSEPEAARAAACWDDAPQPPRRRAVPGAGEAGVGRLLAQGPRGAAGGVRFIPVGGGLAQEAGAWSAILANRALSVNRGGGAAGGGGGRASGAKAGARKRGV